MDQKTLKQRLAYAPDTGIFTWRDCRHPHLNGKIAGCLEKQGYIVIRIDGRGYGAHRLAWLYVHGAFPDGEIDHRNGVRDDNRIRNFRIAKTQKEQQQNAKLRSNNTSGHTGVSWHKQRKKWRARIGAGGSRIYLGYFDDVLEAALAYRQAKARLHTFNPELRES